MSEQEERQNEVLAAKMGVGLANELGKCAGHDMFDRLPKEREAKALLQAAKVVAPGAVVAASATTGSVVTAASAVMAPVVGVAAASFLAPFAIVAGGGAAMYGLYKGVKKIMD